jgi:hypothetical protein
MEVVVMQLFIAAVGSTALVTVIVSAPADVLEVVVVVFGQSVIVCALLMMLRFLSNVKIVVTVVMQLSTVVVGSTVVDKDEDLDVVRAFDEVVAALLDVAVVVEDDILEVHVFTGV